MTSDDSTTRYPTEDEDPSRRFEKGRMLVVGALLVLVVACVAIGTYRTFLLGWVALVVCLLVLHDETALAVRRTVLRLRPRWRFERVRIGVLLVGLAVAAVAAALDVPLVAWAGALVGVLHRLLGFLRPTPRHRP